MHVEDQPLRNPRASATSAQGAIGNDLVTETNRKTGAAWNFGAIPILPPEASRSARSSSNLAGSGVLQTKLEIGPVDDPLEREADTVADRVIGGAVANQRSGAEPRGGGPAVADVQNVVESGLSSGGERLAGPLRDEMEQKLGFDFSRVRVHTNSSASLSTEKISAKAYASGPNIVFRSGAYQPGNASGKWLLAHELAHVAQQGGAVERDARFKSSPTAANPVASFQASGRSQTPVAGVVQRDDLFTPNVAPTPDYAKLNWQDLLPKARGNKGADITKIDLHTPGNSFEARGTGQAPTLVYKADKDITKDPVWSAPQGGGGGGTTPAMDAQGAADNAAFAAAQERVISQIVAARANIPSRSIGRSPNNNAGYDYDPDKDPAAQDYNQWTKTALPTGVQSGAWNWQVFKEIQALEGQVGRFTTFDKTLTIGAGFSSSGGQAQRIVGKTFKALPGVKATAFAAGLIVDETGTTTVVDPDKKWILTGADALNYLQTEPALLSLLVNVSQGVESTSSSPTSGVVASSPEKEKQRQSFLDIEFQQFVDGTLNGLTGLVRSWPVESAVLAVHAKHAQPGNFPFTFWDSHSDPGLAAMVAAIFSAVGASARFICTGRYAAFVPKGGGPAP
jgi:hypothetical protein